MCNVGSSVDILIGQAKGGDVQPLKLVTLGGSTPELVKASCFDFSQTTVERQLPRHAAYVSPDEIITAAWHLQTRDFMSVRKWQSSDLDVLTWITERLCSGYRPSGLIDDAVRQRILGSCRIE